jgi:hydrogenase maturation protein HypF
LAIVEKDGVNIVRLDGLFRAIIQDVKKNVSQSKIAMKFHRTMAEMVVQMCQRLARMNSINKVALSGGVFQNRLLLRLTVAALEEAGFEVLTHSKVPTNDGGVSLGQAVVANFVVSE